VTPYSSNGASFLPDTALKLLAAISILMMAPADSPKNVEAQKLNIVK